MPFRKRQARLFSSRGLSHLKVPLKAVSLQLPGTDQDIHTLLPTVFLSLLLLSCPKCHLQGDPSLLVKCVGYLGSNLIY